ncbi:3'-5' exonuclease [Sulfuracidifex metallicus]|uniref:3'-5' exonuclease n=1 Tax=Sulfuracidifex metallicus TaxID=47303 RepID=UPI0006CFC195|nr:3'-5' exonuclease [Sulfuracidifex metallicus]
MWTISKEGKRSLLIKDDFYPYFYVLPRSDSNLKEKILELSGKNYEIKDVSNDKKIYLGKELDVLKVACSLPTSIRYFRDVISKMGDVKGIFEADIRFP